MCTINLVVNEKVKSAGKKKIKGVGLQFGDAHVSLNCVFAAAVSCKSCGAAVQAAASCKMA